VKGTGGGKSIGVVIHICMETTQGNSLCSYPYLKLAKITCFSFYLLFFSSTKSENRRAEQVLLQGGLAPVGEKRWKEKG
jgi:hypothetical protein